MREEKEQRIVSSYEEARSILAQVSDASKQHLYALLLALTSLRFSNISSTPHTYYVLLLIASHLDLYFIVFYKLLNNRLLTLKRFPSLLKGFLFKIGMRGNPLAVKRLSFQR